MLEHSRTCQSLSFPPAGEDVVTTSEERTKQGNLFGIGLRCRTRNGNRHLTRRRGLDFRHGTSL
jgi:hypothetical protein